MCVFISVYMFSEIWLYVHYLEIALCNYRITKMRANLEIYTEATNLEILSGVYVQS